MGLLRDYSVPGLLVLAVQIACILHVIRNGRATLWIMLILFAPGIGAVVYFIVEVWPDLRAGRRGGLNLKIPETSAGAIKRLQDELEFSNTVAKRVELAQALASARRFDEAAETLAVSLRGVFKDDPVLTLELAEVHFQAGRHAETLAALETLDRLKSKDGRQRRLLLAARSLQALGRKDEARERFETALEQASGEEPRCRLAQFLIAEGETAKARALFEELLRNAKVGGGVFRRHNREWIALAKEGLAALKSEI
jgi:hypothetical protein